ncbi:hypothetical protein PJL18_03825 [Paenarthrobacter nicotinovorans]|nr:hypothetical protein [Paenarthrobacter nicotinovorans]
MRTAGEVHRADQRLAVVAPADEGEDVMVRVATVDPLEPAGLVVLLVERGSGGVHLVEVLDQELQAAVSRNVGEEPVQSVLLGPLRFLAELSTHEDELLAGVRPLVREEGTKVGQLLPAVARHLAQHGAFPMDHFVMADGQEEILRERINQREGDGAVVPLAVDGVFGDVLQGVVHPAHVPLQAKAQTAVVGGCRNAGECGGLLGNDDSAGV